MVSEFQSKEQRRHRRVPATTLTAQLKSRQGLFTKWVDMQVLDFNTLGVAIALPSEPELGGKLNLKLVLNMDMGELSVSAIEARVVNKMMYDKNKSLWRVGLVFSTQSKQNGDNEVQLERIQEMLLRNEAIKQRLTA